jgi:hypothetical protein
MSSYQYNISDDFSNGVNLRKLRNEIGTQINIPIEKTSIFGNTLKINFESSLDSGDQTLLTSVISGHDATTNVIDKNYASDKTESTTTSSSYQTKLNLETEYLDAGDYKISWSFSYQVNRIQSDVLIELDGIEIQRHYSRHISNSGSYIYTASGFNIETLTDGKHTITVKFKGGSGRYMKITNVNLHVEELS